jgi:hypothetical protein
MSINIKSLSLEEKKKLFVRLKKEKGHKIKERITPQDRKDRIPTSFQQELQIYSIEAKMFDPEECRIPGPAFGYTFKEELNINALNRAIKEIVRRHEILRTKYEIIDGEKFQVVNEIPENILSIVDLKNLPEKAEKKEEAARIIKKRSSDTFDIFNDPLMIMFMLILRGDRCDLIVTTHHIATDADAMPILQKELFVLYQAFSNNIPSPLPELPIQYSDFSIWQRKQYSSENISEKLVFLKKELTDRLELKLPIDRNEPYKGDLSGDVETVIIEAELEEQLITLSNATKISLFTTLFTAYMALVYCFSRYTYNEAVITLSEKKQEEIWPLIGCFADFQNIKIDFNGDPNFQELLNRTNNKLLAARDNFIPYSLYLKQTQIPAQTGFNFVQFPDKLSRLQSGASLNDNIIPIRIPQPVISIYPLSMMLVEVPRKIAGAIVYQTELYEPETIQRLVSNYIRLLKNIVNNPKLRISEMDIEPHESAFSTHDIIYNQA